MSKAMAASLITLPTATRLALRRFAAEHGLSIEEAAAVVTREYLIGAGYLEPDPELSEGTEVEGSA
jgi:hypothetical protein